MLYYMTANQLAQVFASNAVRTIGINQTHICYSGESFTIRNDKTVCKSVGWEIVESSKVMIDFAYVDHGDLFILLADNYGEVPYKGELNGFNTFLSSEVRMEWNIGVENGKWLYENPIVKGLIIYSTGVVYIY